MDIPFETVFDALRLRRRTDDDPMFQLCSTLRCIAYPILLIAVVSVVAARLHYRLNLGQVSVLFLVSGAVSLPDPVLGRWTEIPLALLLGSLVSYLVHRLEHTHPWLWRRHGQRTSMSASAGSTTLSRAPNRPAEKPA